MNATVSWKRLYGYLRRISVAVIPVIFLMLAILIHFISGKFYLLNTDPEYFHFMNGLNLSILNLAVDYIDHPGTTIEVLFAISAHIVNLLFPGSDLISNALNHPEAFIHGANILLNVITACALFLLGYFTLKHTGNVPMALLMQLTPFYSIRLLIVSGRVLPESVIIPILIFLILFIIKYIYDTEQGRNSKLYALAFAIIGGLGMATKLSYFPFLIIPLFLLDAKKRIKQYLLYTPFAIIIFAFPLFINLGKSWRWYSNMLLHSGQWGSGDTNFVDLAKVPGRLQKIFDVDHALFILIGFAVIQLIIFYSFRFFRNKGHLTILLKRTLLAVIVAIIIFVLFVTKHFAYHYILPVLVLKAFVIFLIGSLLLSVIGSKNIRKYLSLAVFLLTLMLIVPQSKYLGASVKIKQAQTAKFEDRERMLDSYNTKDNLLIISPHYRGSPFMQTALAGGFMLSGQLRSTFKKQLRETYPHTVLYVNWNDQFYLWDKFMDADEFLDPQKTAYIFIGEGKKKDLQIILDRISNCYPAYSLDLEVEHIFRDPNETFYKLKLHEK
jgi:hypothetical protein